MEQDWENKGLVRLAQEVEQQEVNELNYDDGDQWRKVQPANPGDNPAQGGQKWSGEPIKEPVYRIFRASIPGDEHPDKNYYGKHGSDNIDGFKENGHTA